LRIAARLQHFNPSLDRLREIAVPTRKPAARPSVLASARAAAIASVLLYGLLSAGVEHARAAASAELSAPLPRQLNPGGAVAGTVGSVRGGCGGVIHMDVATEYE